MIRIGRATISRRHPPFQVLDRTFAILDAFDEDHPEWSATDLARSLELPVPTTHRILTALKQRGYVSQHEETKRFRLGTAALQLGDRARAVVDLPSVAFPWLRKLSHETGETALLTGLTTPPDRAVCLERVEASSPLRLSVSPGRQLLLHAGASQKVLFAFLDEEQIEHVIDGGLEHLCRATITDPHALRDELAKIRKRGWASSYEETNVGVWGVAVPVLGPRQEIVCAVGIAGPSARLNVERVRADVTKVYEAARGIADALGYTVPIPSGTGTSIKPRRRASYERKEA